MCSNTGSLPPLLPLPGLIVFLFPKWSSPSTFFIEPRPPALLIILFFSYHSLRNCISSLLKRSKASFFHSLSHCSPSKFWSFDLSRNLLPLFPSSLPVTLPWHRTLIKLTVLILFSPLVSTVQLHLYLRFFLSHLSPLNEFLCSDNDIVSLIPLPTKTASDPDGTSFLDVKGHCSFYCFSFLIFPFPLPWNTFPFHYLGVLLTSNLSWSSHIFHIMF